MTRARPSDQALAVPAGPVARPSPSGFDPSRFEYRFSVTDKRERHDWIVSGKLGAINIWAEPTAYKSTFLHENWFGGIECHSATPPEYSGGHHEHCWLLGAECWHDGSSLQFSEEVEERLPEPCGKPIDGEMLDDLKSLLLDRYRSWLTEPASAIETGTAKTAGLGPEGESAAPKVDAQPLVKGETNHG